MRLQLGRLLHYQFRGLLSVHSGYNLQRPLRVQPVQPADSKEGATGRKRLLTVSHKLSHISFLKRHLVHQNTLKRSRSFNNLRGAERFTNRLLYQLSYVGLGVYNQSVRWNLGIFHIPSHIPSRTTHRHVNGNLTLCDSHIQNTIHQSQTGRTVSLHVVEFSERSLTRHFC